jgi:hypothetical protein
LLALGVCAGTGCAHEVELEDLDSQQHALFALSKEMVLDWSDHALQAVAANDGHADPLFA